jgi:signal transduction histidine kinase
LTTRAPEGRSAAAAGTLRGNISIAKRLFLSATILSFTILLIAGVVLSHFYQRAAEANFDERLSVYLHALVADIATPSETGETNPEELSDPQFALALSGWYWQITRLDSDKQQIRSSRSLFAARLPRLADAGVPAGLGGARRGYAIGPDGRRLRIVERVIDTGDNGIYLVQVAATTGEIEAAIERFDAYLVVTFGLLAIALIASSAAQLRYGLAPLRQLQEGVAAIRRGEAESIEGALSPDLAPLAGELNLLIGANRAVVERARTQVGNLAHALKTPLSVIINEAALQTGPSAGKVQEQAAIMRDQVSYYLHRAVAAVRAGAVASATDVGPVAQSLAAAFEKIYAERAISFAVDMPQPVRFLGERQDLEEMIGNLADNAGKWAMSAVRIAIAPEFTQSGAERSFFRVAIEDDGPGLAPELREAALKRGRRLDETKPGSGLGLSIVADLASLYGGDLTLEVSPMGGLRAVLRLPSTSNAPRQTRP